MRWPVWIPASLLPPHPSYPFDHRLLTPGSQHLQTADGLVSTIRKVCQTPGATIRYADAATVVNTTINGNTALSGGGLFNSGAARLNLTNTIIAGSLGGGDCFNISTVGGTNSHNLTSSPGAQTASC
jgi:hypothetical protein